MLIFSDFHHSDLYRSLYYLFEKRLGGKLFCPTGMEWVENKIWLYASTLPNYLEIALQFLKTWKEDKEVEEGIFERVNGHDDIIDRRITLKKFFEIPFDIVIASVQNHEKSFYELAKKHPNKPKFIRQIGNWGEQIDFQYSQNIMLSATPLKEIPENVNMVSYHQEFDLDLFCCEPPKVFNSIKNFMNCLPQSPYHSTYQKYKKDLSDYNWKMYGILGEDRNIGSIKKIAEEIKSSTFIWHTKQNGDGFGHTLFNSFACGRPVITFGYDYENKLAGKLLEDQKTCIDLDKHSEKENVELIKKYSQPEKHLEMCKNVYNKFKEVVDYKKEEEKIKEFLNKLKV